jgi:pSer/pThr/pTyr-binding forkhead associated (FHA) protein
VYLRDAGSSSGTFLNKMRLSPATKISRPYPLKEGDVIQLGVDYQGRTEGFVKAKIRNIQGRGNNRIY